VESTLRSQAAPTALLSSFRSKSARRFESARVDEMISSITLEIVTTPFIYASLPSPGRSGRQSGPGGVGHTRSVLGPSMQCDSSIHGNSPFERTSPFPLS